MAEVQAVWLAAAVDHRQIEAAVSIEVAQKDSPGGMGIGGDVVAIDGIERV